MSDYFATVALMPDGQLKKIQLEDYLGKYVLIIFYQGDFTLLATSELSAFASENDKFAENDCQVHIYIFSTYLSIFDEHI